MPLSPASVTSSSEYASLIDEVEDELRALPRLLPVSEPLRLAPGLKIAMGALLLAGAFAVAGNLALL